MKTAIITGIDGTGKSTYIKQLYAEYAGKSSAGFFACPSYHHLPGSQMDELSIIFEKINSFGNEYKHNDIKALGLYLQMSLYSPVLKIFEASPDINIVISERNAIIDTVVYGSLYAKSITGNIEQAHWQPLLEKELDQLFPGAFQKVQEWINYLNGFTGEGHSFWNYTGFLKKLFTSTPESIIENLCRFFNLALPDVICFLKIDPHVAIERLKQREKQLELHENPALLEALQMKYLSLLNLVKKLYPDITIHILENTTYGYLKQHLPITSKAPMV
jgi:thymidylate kinase